MIDSYFIALGENKYSPTSLTGGSWREDELHLAPVAGVVVHHMERWRRENVDPSLKFGRFSIEVLGQIPRGEVALSTKVVRPGRTIELIETTALIGERAIILARGWLLQQSDTSEISAESFPPMPTLEACVETSGLELWPGEFIRSLRTFAAPGSEPLSAKAWILSDRKLVAGEPAEPLAEYVKVLDTANGVASHHLSEAWMFPNVEITLHFFRDPQAGPVGLDTHVAFGGNGIGLTSSIMHDVLGPVGAVQQSTTVRRMPPR